MYYDVMHYDVMSYHERVVVRGALLLAGGHQRRRVPLPHRAPLAPPVLQREEEERFGKEEQGVRYRILRNME